MEDLVISTDTVNVLNTSDVTNTVRVVESEPVLIATESGTVVTLASESTVVLQIPEPSVLVTGIIGPPGTPGINEEDMVYSKRVDFVTDNELYKAEATVGSSEASPVWRIRKLVIGSDGDVTETWAFGNANFDKIWADRASLTYT